VKIGERRERRRRKVSRSEVVVTDFRRPDLDLWDEEDDGEDQRPTIVSERPPAPSMPAYARMSLMQRLIAKGELEDGDEGHGAPSAQHKASNGLPPASPRLLGQPKRPGRGRPQAQSPIEVAARDAAEVQGDNTEILDERELDLLRLSEPPGGAADRTTAVLEAARPLGAPLPQAARRIPETRPYGTTARRLETRRGEDVGGSWRPGTELPESSGAGEAWRPGTELPDSSGQPEMDEEDFVPTRIARPEMDEEDFVPTRLARRPRGTSPAVQRVPPAILDAPGFLEREITQRISIPPLASSIAPTTQTVRPLGRPQRGMGGWQLALVATLLIGAGLGVARLRRENTAGVSSAAVGSAAIGSAAGVSAGEPPAPEPAVAPAEPEPPPAPAEAAPAAAGAEALSSAAAKPARRSRSPLEGASPTSPAAPAVGQTEPELGAAAPVPEPKGQRAVGGAQASGQDLPLQPSREDVRSALDAVIPELQKCVGEQHGDADVTMVVRSHGVVSYAVVSGSFAGTPEGSCIARSVKLAKFPAFSAPSLRVTYPFSL
jgi:hypothetical protein